MRYLMLICTDESADEAIEPGERERAWPSTARSWRRWASGVCCRAASACGPTTDATTVRVRDGETVTSDGPFAETKEQIGGYFVVDCKDLDEAIEIAAKIPGARFGSIEVQADLGDVTPDVEAAVATAFREEWGRVVATLIRVTGDWDVAEECAQDAFVLALEQLATRRRPAQSRRVAHDDRPQPRDRPRPAGHDGRVEAPGGHRAVVVGSRPSRPSQREPTTAASTTTGCG